ncbi:MAG TPA: PEP-CTERM sorting domain-containing protein, partial [Bryobacteraceae bacterium]|nr:PEP-CTERM sorting domain-containing protein [Bryobacteraceae bacterium]
GPGGGVVNFAGDASLGYNTTPGGSQFVHATSLTGVGVGSRLTFSFDQPIQAFGVYITGANQVTPPFSPFRIQTFLLNGGSRETQITASDQGGAMFVGFTDIVDPVRQVNLFSAASRGGVTDPFSIDDVSFGSTVAPEPSTLILAGLGALLVIDFAWRRRKPAA